jgi:signal transduction histidine kinase
MEQVLVNILTNAIHAMPGGGTLTISTSEKVLTAGDVEFETGDRTGDRLRAGDHAVVIKVADSGTGIPPDKIGRIFDPFFTTKPTGQGTGLGLSVVKQIIDLHRGTISITNGDAGGAVAVIMLKEEPGHTYGQETHSAGR